MVFAEALVVGLVMAVVQVIKYYLDIPKVWYPLIVMGLAIGCNLTTVAVWGDAALLEAAKQGLQLGAMAAGLYGLGKAALKDKQKA